MRRGSLLVHNAGGECYTLCRSATNKQIDRMATLQRMGVVLNTLEVPKANTDWIKVVRQEIRGAAYLDITMSPYHWPWLVRAYLITDMRPHGIMQLQVDSDWSWAEIEESMEVDFTSFTIGKHVYLGASTDNAD